MGHFINITFLLFCFNFSAEKPLDVKQELFEHGFLTSLEENPEVLGNAIEKFQQANGLQVTGNLTEETLKKMSSPRCGKAPKLEARNRVKWSKSHITYKIKNCSAPFTEILLRNTFENYIAQWTEEIDLKITESTAKKADIEVYFSKQDGQYGVLGYAYLPENGDIYFDESEEWIFDTSDPEKIFFGWVAAHELGHALGLPHVESKTSIMNPYYSNKVTNPSNSDLKNIKSLYGKAEKVDALLKTEELILIKGRKYCTILNHTVQAGPFSLELKYPGLPNRIDAAFSLKNVVYFFKKNVFFKFKKGQNSFVRKLISVGFEKVPSYIDAAFFDPNSNYIYFFKGSNYYIFDIYEQIGKRLIAKKKISYNWPIPNNIEAAALLDNSRVLFIKKLTCYTVDLATKELLSEQRCASLYDYC